MSLRHQIEAALVRAGLGLLRAIGPRAASGLGGAVLRGVGPRLPVSRVADANQRLALPELGAAERRRIVRAVWDNLGRTMAEMPHVAGLGPTRSGPGWEIVGEEAIADLAAQGGPAILFAGHIANWEFLPVIAARRGLAMASMYRAASNPHVDRIVQEMRGRAVGAAPHFPKGAAGARAALAHLKAGGILALLADQKMNDGIPAPFFGHLAMTASAPAAMALRFRAKLIPVQVQRLGPARMRVVIEPPLPLPDSGDRAGDIAALTTAMNACLERWIRARPGDWLWLHRRWPRPDEAARLLASPALLASTAGPRDNPAKHQESPP